MGQVLLRGSSAMGMTRLLAEPLDVLEIVPVLQHQRQLSGFKSHCSKACMVPTCMGQSCVLALLDSRSLHSLVPDAHTKADELGYWMRYTHTMTQAGAGSQT